METLPSLVWVDSQESSSAHNSAMRASKGVGGIWLDGGVQQESQKIVDRCTTGEYGCSVNTET